MVEPRDEVKARIASATELLVRADGVDDRRVRSALSRARKAMTDLAAAMTDYTDRAETRARIVELEQELADAKAALRRPRPTPKPATAARPTTPCSKGCGRQLYAQGRVTHERSCRGAAVAS